ncbi:hypothetical protein SCHPADRAFT_824188 [Schizopora paradoxa]|uniref:Ferritin-like domain-containing protein n=1 Tax=Schizopora paradoxa TaxID=27342 RepID=A0A0H2SFA6_9AGAM|nr:hypothetical protein SCHPADRAFT_824188 [Schizopora paradoxa]
MLFASALLSIPLLASSVAGVPIKRQSSNSTATASNSTGSADLLVLKFANVLEQLETQFYTEALQKFQTSDFTAAGFADANVPIQQFTNIMNDESTHTTVLAAAIQSLGDQPISGCTFDFSSVLTSVSAMAPVARLVENVGVGAYLGAAHLLDDPVLLTAAGSILTVEARHQTILNVLNGGTAIPQAFDIPLDPQEVLAIAGSFISGCDTGITGLPPLTVTTTGSIQAGTSLSFSFDALSSISDTSTLSCQMLAGGMPASLSLPFDQCVVPTGLTGPVAIYVTNNTQPLVNNPRDKFLGNIVAGPTMAFIDNDPEDISSLAITGQVGNSVSNSTGSSSSDSSSTSADSSTSTATISPASASSVAAAAGATSTDSGSLSNNVGGVPPTANTETGTSPDGAISVSGWTTIPAPTSS